MSASTTDSSAPPTVEEVERIVAIANPVVRNLEITHCYGRLSAAMAQRTGPCANWCTFATWASRQAGRTIRGEDLIETLRTRLHAGPELLHPLASLGRVLLRKGLFDPQSPIGRLTGQLHTPFDVFERTSDAVGRGNRKVFEEIGLEFARYLQDVAPAAGSDPADPHLRAFLDGLRPGEPPDGQRYLRQAFTRYTRAAQAEDEAARAQLLLLANLEIGMHEQTRLQPEITAALDALVVDPKQFRRRLIKALFPARSWLVRLRLFFRRLLGRPARFDAATNALVAIARQHTRAVITEHLMTLGLPSGGRLRLGSDLSGEFPASLKEITNPDLHALLERIDPTPDSLRETGAVDWAELPDRLHFILDMFRCYQERRDLFEPPFTPEQVAALTAGRLPGGRL